MKRLFYCLIFFSMLNAWEIELYCDFAPEAKGQTMFPMNDESLVSMMRKELVSKGNDIRSWELDQYLPFLMSLKRVQTFQDFKHWLGVGIEKSKAVHSTTKYWMFWNLGPKILGLDFKNVPKEKLVLVMWEPPTVQKELYDLKIQQRFGKIFTWDDDLVDHQTFFKFHYPALKNRLEEIPAFEEKKFCVMISRRLTSKHPKELYSERRRAIKFFEEKPEGEFDLYGYYWKKKKYKNYQGPLYSDKIEKLKEYKFSICYENMKDVKGYITEKIFDCFAAGTVPVYWGASNVTDYIPKECFIDRRDFEDNEALYQFLKKMPKETYQVYLDQTAEFLKSEKAKKFTNEAFIESVLFRL